MTMQSRLFPAVVFVVILFSGSISAQPPERRQANATPPAQEQSPNLPPNSNSMDIVANEMGLLRKSVQALNLRLREISEKVLAPGSNQPGSPNDKQNRIALNLEILTRAEQRAEILRKELLERIEKEASLKSRLVQIEEEIRPESIERTMSGVGSTRTYELREVRRRVLETERRALESLLNQVAQSRHRLEEDVKQADSLVFKLRQRILPLLEKEIEKINPN